MEKEILVVDDERDICEVLDISLSDIGYRVHTAENGEEALRVFEEVNPPIVLTDIRMPGIDGIELLRRIKEKNPETEVIMITGHGDMDIAIKSLKLEATDFITKPINEDVLEIALKRAHDRIDMREQLKAYTENLEELVKEKSARLVKAERLLAVGQVVEWLPTATKDMIEDLEDGITYFNEMPCLVSIHNRDLEVVATNRLYKERLGDKIGSNSWDMYRTGAGDRAKCPVGKTFNTGKGQRNRETILDRDGNEVPVIVHTAPIGSGEGDIELVLEIAVDVTEVNRLQEELRTTQQRYQQLFDEVPCYISVQDRDLRLTATNRQFKEDFGEDTRHYCYKVYKHRDTPCEDCPVIKTFQEEKSQQYETVVTSKRGERINVLVWTAPLRNLAGEVTHVMEMSTNITQIRMLQDRLTSMGLLLSSISHSIKGLLTGLDGGMYWLDSGIEKGNQERLQKGWKATTLIVGRIRNLVLNLLYYAKERDLDWKMTDIAKFAGDVARTFEPNLEGQPIEFVREFGKSRGKFECDAGVFSSALMSILENAKDACLEDKSKKSHRIVFRVSRTKDHVIFHIQDNGTGMDRETKENMFTLFFSSKGNKGTGLGLFVSDEIVRQHGGSINVDSNPGKGSHFEIMVPKTIPEQLKRLQEEKNKTTL
jgi:PAS domain S-box-containing protein